MKKIKVCIQKVLSRNKLYNIWYNLKSNTGKKMVRKKSRSLKITRKFGKISIDFLCDKNEAT